MSKLYRTIGPPGCGKTTWLARQCQNASHKYGGQSIAIASLTRTAAAEIASRSTGVPRENIGTLHSHAFRRLELKKDRVAETTQGIKEWNDKTPNHAWQLSRRSVANPENAGPDDFSSHESTGDEILAEIGVLRAKCVDARVWPNRVQGFWNAWSAWKSDSGRVDFTDMVCRALEDVDELGVDILMIDEAQDMSLLEMKLANKWGSAAEQLLVVGDPDQTIYEWRGADPSAFYEGEADLVQTLAQSYRVPKAVHAKAVEWIEQIRDRQQVDYHPRDEAGLVNKHQMACWRDPDGIVNLCERLASGGSSVAVLASCGYMLTPLVMKLKENGITFNNPYRVDRWEWNPLRTKIVEALISFQAPKIHGRLWTWDEVWKWVKPLRAKDTMKRGAASYFEAKAITRTKWETDEERVIKELGNFLGEFLPEHQQAVFNCDAEWWLSHLKHAEHQRGSYAVAVSKRHGFRALLEQPRISVGTIHSYKGGEADKVVLIPDLSRAGAEQYFGRERDAVVRLFYVGMTRARHELHVVGAAGPDYAHI